MHYTKVKSILSASGNMNIYRGCVHGCIYCDSRSRCYHMEHAFEDVEVKENAIELLEQELKRRRSRCMIGTGSMTDPYIPAERALRYVRRALELAEKYGYGFTLITKSDMVLRDMDLLKAIHEKAKCVVQMTLTTFDDDLCRILEPNVCSTARRIEVLKTLRDAGIPTVVWLSPILPFINDTPENIQGILDACVEAGVKGIICFGMGLTLREGNREYFYAALDRHFPGMKERYIRSFGDAYAISSPRNSELMGLFQKFCRTNDILCDNDAIFRYLRSFEDRQEQNQLSLF